MATVIGRPVIDVESLSTPRAPVPRRPDVAAPVAATRPPDVVAPLTDGPPWRVTAAAGEHRYTAERRARIVVGSLSTCDWVIDEPGVRPVHCELLFDAGWCLCARAPVRFLGLDVHGWLPVASGDVVELGDVHLQLEFELLAAPPEQPLAAPRPASRPDPVTNHVDVPAEPAPAAPATPGGDDLFRLPEAEHTVTAPAPSGKGTATRAGLGLVLLALLAAVYLVKVRSKAAKPAPRANAGAVAAAAATSPAPPPPLPTATLTDPALARTATEGVAALREHDYQTASEVYRRIVVESGSETAQVFVRALESRRAAPCRRARRPVQECLQ